MKGVFKIIIGVLVFLGVSSALLTLFIKSHSIPMLEPKGLIAMKERELILTAASLMMIIVVPVLLIALIFAWKYRSANEKTKYLPNWEHDNIAECCWWGIPFLIVAILAVIAYKTCHTLDPFKPIKNGQKPIEIQVVALDWKWLFIYPEQGIASVNFFQIPEKTPINFELTADAPMNSFWIPQLGGQIYAMPAMRSQLHLIANEVGEYRGGAAHISGKGFAGMRFKVKASTKEAFETWVGKMKDSPLSLGTEEYKRLIEPSEYDPVTLYVLTQPDLFDQIIMKYKKPKMVPREEK